VAEASAVVANAVPSAVILTLRNVAVVAREALFAGARAVEAVPVRAKAVVTCLEGAIASVPPFMAHALASTALAVPVAARRSTKVDRAVRTAKAIGTEAHALHAHSLRLACGAGLGLAVLAFIALGAFARGILRT